MASWQSWASPFPRPPSPSIWFAIAPHRLILGGSFSIIMQTTWCRSTFSLCRPQPSEFCSSSSSFATTVAVSFISMSPNILLPSGRRSKWSMLFHGTRRLGTLCLLFIHPPAHGSEVGPAARNTLDSARIPRASKLLICGLLQKGRVLAQDGEKQIGRAYGAPRQPSTLPGSARAVRTRK